MDFYCCFLGSHYPLSTGAPTPLARARAKLADWVTCSAFWFMLRSMPTPHPRHFLCLHPCPSCGPWKLHICPSCPPLSLGKPGTAPSVPVLRCALSLRSEFRLQGGSPRNCWEELLETSTSRGFFGHLRAITSTGSE